MKENKRMCTVECLFDFMIMLLQILIKTVSYIFSHQKQNDGFLKQRNVFFSLNRSRKGVVRKCGKVYYNLSKWKQRHDEIEKLHNAQRRRAARLEALLANGGVAPAGDTSVTTEDLAPGSGLCAAPSPRHRRHAKADGVTVASKVTMKMATAQACLTAAVKEQKRSTRVQLYKEAGQSAKKGLLATSLRKSLQINRRTLLHPRNLTAPQLAAQEKAEMAAPFLVRDDNLSEMPGKKDQKRVGDD